jgi:hypothetical protein
LVILQYVQKAAEDLLAYTFNTVPYPGSKEYYLKNIQSVIVSAGTKGLPPSAGLFSPIPTKST